MAEARPDDVIRIDAGGWGLSWAPSADGTLHQVGLGPAGAAATRDVDAHWYPRAFPTLDGTDPFRPPALHVVHADGTLSTRLALDDVDRSDAADGSGEHVVLTTVDELFDLTVEHHLRTHPDSGVLEQWVEVVNAEDGPVTLLSHDSIAPFLMVPDDAEYVQFGGAGWADEWRWSAGRPVIGTTVLGSLGGVQPHLQRSPCLLLSPTGPFDVDAAGAPAQDRGEVIGLSVAWGGNSHVSLDLRPAPNPARPASCACGPAPTPSERRTDSTPGRGWCCRRWPGCGRAPAGTA